MILAYLVIIFGHALAKERHESVNASKTNVNMMVDADFDDLSRTV